VANDPCTGAEEGEEAEVAEDLELLADFVADAGGESQNPQPPQNHPERK
jgi:hypothetical protein